MNEIHHSFIKSLVIVAIVTIVSMASARYFVTRVLDSDNNSSVFTSQKSQISPNQ